MSAQDRHPGSGLQITRSPAGFDVGDQIVDLGAGQRQIRHRAVRMREPCAQLAAAGPSGFAADYAPRKRL
jgi:hypothetical protein